MAALKTGAHFTVSKQTKKSSKWTMACGVLERLITSLVPLRSGSHGGPYRGKSGWELGAGGWGLGAGSWELGAGGWELGAGGLDSRTQPPASPLLHLCSSLHSNAGQHFQSARLFLCLFRVSLALWDEIPTS